ncbi:thioredoxin family protein [Bacillus aquiflavi]|uniref:Thioredoxin family protein n=1 Tax=Bacillus aquiflavi TaxID=2672567 RepID=A0A6B3VSP2_9BACI|nr:thioredoxin family protein [Bacillus aquiflavi]MBA4535606.1 thioredoxin family protein [Bacillus aquiflavi]NEY79982.1 thioredoxin family protein [Bacillus aquiflavi]UAC48923.1 thioredoxin family protein [Bacillus aquiflavi]
MKKIIVFLVIVIALFAGIAFATKVQQEKKAEGNPYNKDSLNSETIALLDDENYSNIILPEELKEKIDNGEDVTVYFYSPTCGHCREATPVVKPLADELGIDLFQYNVLEFEQGWDDYNINSTPTIIQFNDGKETARIEGNRGEGTFKAWFKENSL